MSSGAPARPVAPGHRRGPALGLAGGQLLLLCPPGPRAAEASCPYRWPGPCCSPHLTFFFFLVVLYNFVEESFALRQSTPCIDAHESLFSDAHSTISVSLAFLAPSLDTWLFRSLGSQENCEVMFPCHCLHVQPQRGSRLRNSAVAHAPRVSPRARRSAHSEGPTRQCRLRGQSHLLGSSVLPLIGFAVWAGDVPSRRLVSSAVKSVLVFSPWEV